CPTTATGDQGDQSRAHTNGNGHVPVTVCHLLGNGGYHVLTFDQHALPAHLGHGDLYPVPADGCPTTATEQPAAPGTGGTTETGTDGTTEDAVVVPPTTGLTVTPAAQVLGVQEIRTGSATPVASKGSSAAPATVLGTQALAPNAAARVAPATGLLPNTGADDVMLPLLGGLGLVAAGAGMVARRRTRTEA
ncbi:MAG: LPXTG cell wall anchor domain-containing protein, partial [Nocardioidaceae bacterium]